VVVLLGLLASSCAIRHTTKVEASKVPPPSQEASTADLVARVNAWSAGIRTLVATVDLEPTTGSVYSGVIKEYHDVKGFILFEKPTLIRMVGQAPIIRTQIFDMASDGKQFRVYVAPKEKFIVGNTESTRPAKNSLETLRPQHIVEALLVPPLDPARESYFREEGEENDRRYYVLTVLEPGADRELSLKRKVWFDRTDLAITELQVYGRQGAYSEDVRYAGYQDFEGVRYPTQIQIRRPIEDYRLTISILKATFNQPIEPEKFELEKPKNAELVDLTAASPGVEPHGQ
jgi:outer membrane lipoprotein-sorting protein